MYVLLVIVLAWIVSMGGEFSTELMGFVWGVGIIILGLGLAVLAASALYHACTHS